MKPIIQKNSLHYYVELIRMKDREERSPEQTEFCVTALHNVICTMRFSRRDNICGEDFSRLDFGNIPLNNIKWSLGNGNNPTVFSKSKLHTINFMSGNLQTVTSGCFSPDNIYAATISNNEIVIWNCDTGIQQNRLIKYNKLIKHKSANEKASYYFKDNSSFAISYKTGILFWDFKTDTCIYSESKKDDGCFNNTRYAIRVKKHKIYIFDDLNDFCIAELDILRYCKNGVIHETTIIGNNILAILIIEKNIKSKDAILTFWNITEIINKYEKDNSTGIISSKELIEKTSINSINFLTTNENSKAIYLYEDSIIEWDAITMKKVVKYKFSDNRDQNDNVMHSYKFLAISPNNDKIMISYDTIPIIYEYPSFKYIHKLGGNIVEYWYYILRKKNQVVISFVSKDSTFGPSHDKLLFDLDDNKIIERCDMTKDGKKPIWATGNKYFVNGRKSQNRIRGVSISDVTDFSFYGIPNLYISNCDFTNCIIDKTAEVIIHQQGGLL